MDNNEITMYELIGLIKDDKAPSKIKYGDIFWNYDEGMGDYCSKNSPLSLLRYIKFDLVNRLNEKVEIISDEDDEWEDIEDITLKGKEIVYGILNEWLDFTANDNEQKICSCIETLGIAMNKLIKNQKHLKEKIENKD